MTDLQELVAELNDDITDPACMDKVLAYVEQLKMQDDEFMEILLSKIDGMVVTWDQPWYQKSNSITRPVTQREEEGSFRTERFSLDESKRLKKNWKNFRKRFGVPDTPICLARWKNTKCKNPNTPVERVRQYVASFLAQGLERNLFQVNSQFIVLYGAPAQGPFTDTEDKIIQICMHHAPSKASIYLPVVLGRQQRGIRKRMKTLQAEKPEKKRKIKWSLPKATELLQSIMKHSEKKLENLKNVKIDTSVWLKVQEDMQLDYNVVQQFWYKFLHVQLFVTHDIKWRKLRKKILLALQSSSYRVWADISWKHVAKEFPDGCTPQFLYHVVYSLVKSYSNKVPSATLQELVEYGFEKLEKHKRRHHNRRLKSLSLNEEGNLEFMNNSKNDT